VPLVLVIAVPIYFVISEAVIETASYGIEEGDVDEIAAGRVTYIWAPLLKEYLEDEGKLVFGSGRYGIRASRSDRTGSMAYVNHAHNMYLNQVVDTGLVGLSVFLIFFIVLFRKIAENRKRIIGSRISDLNLAVIVGVVAYLLSGMTGRQLFPSASTSYHL